MAEQEPLRVFEFGGTARSGKGTIVAHLADVHPGVATEETGGDYRAITLGLLDTGQLEPEMTAQAIDSAVRKIKASQLADLAASRHDLTAERGNGALYAPEVASIVHHVAPLEAVRKAVKAGFKTRVERVRDSEEHTTLLVDGRNLGPVIEAIQGTKLVMRTFVYCTPIEAATRECTRRGLVPRSDEWDQTLSAEFNSISERNEMDKRRLLDPVRPDEDAIYYWTSPSLQNATVGLYASLGFGGDVAKARSTMFEPGRAPTDVARVGAGIKAVSSGRQLHFDTSFFRAWRYPKDDMLHAANVTFEEAVRMDEILSREA